MPNSATPLVVVSEETLGQYTSIESGALVLQLHLCRENAGSTRTSILKGLTSCLRPAEAKRSRTAEETFTLAVASGGAPGATGEVSAQRRKNLGAAMTMFTKQYAPGIPERRAKATCCKNGLPATPQLRRRQGWRQGVLLGRFRSLRPHCARAAAQPTLWVAPPLRSPRQRTDTECS